jgi:hypothetical protein
MLVAKVLEIRCISNSKGSLYYVLKSSSFRSPNVVRFSTEVQSQHQYPNYWKDVNNQSKFLHDLGTKLNIKSQEDWYNVSRDDIIKYGGNSVTLIASHIRWRITQKLLQRLTKSHVYFNFSSIRVVTMEIWRFSRFLERTCQPTQVS